MGERMIVSFMSARGGTGKTTLASCAALLAGQAQKATALLDLDVQFGDLDFAFDLQQNNTLLDICMQARVSPDELSRLAYTVRPDVDLYASGLSPEHAELVIPHVRHLIDSIAHGYELTFINTGAFWSSLQVDVADASDICFIVSEPHAASIRSTLRLKSFFEKARIPSAKLVYLINQPRAQSESDRFDAQMLFASSRLEMVDYGGRDVSDLMDIGRAVGLTDVSNPFVHSVEVLLKKYGILTNTNRFKERAFDLGTVFKRT